MANRKMTNAIHKKKKKRTVTMSAGFGEPGHLQHAIQQQQGVMLTHPRFAVKTATQDDACVTRTALFQIKGQRKDTAPQRGQFSEPVFDHCEWKAERLGVLLSALLTCCNCVDNVRLDELAPPPKKVNPHTKERADDSTGMISSTRGYGVDAEAKYDRSP